MLVRSIFAIALALLTLIGCKEREDLSFFRQSAETQRLQASELETKQVYDLYKLSFEMPPPPTYELLPVIGERGEEALLAWIDDLRSSEDPLNEVWEYGPLLREIRNRTAVTICHDESIFRESSALLHNSSSSRKNSGLSLREYC